MLLFQCGIDAVFVFLARYSALARKDNILNIEAMAGDGFLTYSVLYKNQRLSRRPSLFNPNNNCIVKGIILETSYFVVSLF